MYICTSTIMFHKMFQPAFFALHSSKLWEAFTMNSVVQELLWFFAKGATWNLQIVVFPNKKFI